MPVLPDAVLPAARVALEGWRRVPSSHWPANAARLFPEFALPDFALRGRTAAAGRVVVLPDLAPDLPSGRPQKHRRPHWQIVRVAQAELAAPPFRTGAPWVSGRITALRQDGADLPAWLEQAVCGSPGDGARGGRLLAQLAETRVGGTFWAAAPDFSSGCRPGTGAGVLGCLPDTAAAAADLVAALQASRATAQIVLFAPAAGPVAALAYASGCAVAVAPCDPWPLLDRAEEVHVAGDTPLALLALAAGRRLICHAPAAFAGWGVTTDAAGIPRRGTRSPGELAAAALLGAARHADPFRDRRCTPEEAIAILAEWRRLGTVGREIGSVVSVAFWKRREVMAMLDHGAGAPVACRDPGRAVAIARRRGGAVLAWPSVMPPRLSALAAAAGVPVWQIEDGFVRSVGLGADSAAPHSLVIDRRGIYFDPASPSDLEILLQETRFPAELLARAAALIEYLVARRITKYNTGGAGAAIGAPPGRRVVLVPGQVSDDRSVLLGGAGIGGNLDLLALVRARAPDAFIVYKPHPDVDAGQRAGAVPDDAARRFADRVVHGTALPALLAQADELHTLTSLAGFEALLRRRAVTTYGQPFYAGWGLTTDLAPVSRRTRQLTLEQLVAGTLLLYPRYLDPVTKLPCPVEILLERLTDPAVWRPGVRVRLRQAFGRTRGWLRTRLASRS